MLRARLPFDSTYRVSFARARVLSCAGLSGNDVQLKYGKIISHVYVEHAQICFAAPSDYCVLVCVVQGRLAYELMLAKRPQQARVLSLDSLWYTQP